MFRRGAVLAACIAVIAGRVAYAADPAINAAETSVRLGLTAGYGHYEEDMAPEDNESGALLGAQLSASALRPAGLNSIGLPDLYTGIEYDFSAGFLHSNDNFEGVEQAPSQASDKAYYNTVIVRLGLGWPLPSGEELIPYIAGGYQNWYRNLDEKYTPGAYYQAGLIGGGLRFDIAASPIFVLSATAEGLAVVGGSVSAPSRNFEGDFGTSAEERVGLDADYRLDNAWHAFAGLGLTHYNYTGNKPGGMGVFAPSSATLQINSMLGFSYGF